MRQKKLYFLVILSFTFPKLLPQETKQNKKLFFEGFYHYGFVTPHYNYMSYFVNEHVQGFQFNIGYYTTGKANWQKQFNYPSLGIGYHHSGLSNRYIYGSMNAIYAFADRYFLNIHNRFNFSNRISFGVSYLNKKFDLDTNPFNMAISTNLNVYINYTLAGDIRIFPKTNFKFGLGMTHISNGNMKEPNKGINYITTSVGLKYSITNPDNLRSTGNSFTRDTNKYQIVLTGNIGWKNISRFDDRIFTVYSLTAEYSRKISETGYFGLALANYFDNSLKQELETIDASYSYKSVDLIRTSIHLSYELRMGNLSYMFQPGVYLKNSYKHHGDITNRIGLRYYFNNHLTAGIMVKAHWFAIADLLEWGVGYKF